MNRLFFISYFSLCISLVSKVSAQENWEWQNPKPQGNQIQDVFFVNEKCGWALGQFGKFLKSTDGGINWVTKPYLPFSYLEKLYAVNNLVLFAYGSGLIRSNDGGETWVKVLTHSRFKDMIFVDSLKGWALVESSGIMVTKDGGKTWFPQIFSGVDGLTSIWFTDAKNGFVTCRDLNLLVTKDGGKNWKKKTIGERKPYSSCVSRSDNLNKIHFVNKNEGWIDGKWKTTDGGKNWSIPEEKCKLQCFGQRREIEEILDEKGNSLWKFNNYPPERTWKRLPYGVGFANHQFINEKLAWATGYAGEIFRTADSGKTWTINTYGNKMPMVKGCFLDEKNGFAFGGDVTDDTVNLETKGVVLKTTNGGQVWKELSLKTTTSIRDGIFTDLKNGWILSDDRLYNSVDGGETWKELDLNNFIGKYPIMFYSLFFISTKIGWISTINGMFKTQDGGKTWKNLHSPNFKNMFFLNPRLGFGSPGNISYQTKDGGNSWEPLKIDNKQAEWIYSYDSLTVWAKTVLPGQYDKIFKSSDGGKTWNQQQFTSNMIYGGSTTLKVMFFKSKMMGWAIGEYNELFFTTDGGTTWELNKYRLPQSPFYIASKSEKYFWVFGYMGSILRFEIGKN